MDWGRGGCFSETLFQLPTVNFLIFVLIKHMGIQLYFSKILSKYFLYFFKKKALYISPSFCASILRGAFFNPLPPKNHLMGVEYHNVLREKNSFTETSPLPMKGTKKSLLGVYGLWMGKDLYRATPALTLVYIVLYEEPPKFSLLVRVARHWGPNITLILAGKHSRPKIHSA